MLTQTVQQDDFAQGIQSWNLTRITRCEAEDGSYVTIRAPVTGTTAIRSRGRKRGPRLVGLRLCLDQRRIWRSVTPVTERSKKLLSVL